MAKTLGPRLGVIFFQLPPNIKKDLPRLDALLNLLPDDIHAAFEFRNSSWFEIETWRSRLFRLRMGVSETEAGEVHCCRPEEMDE